MERKSLLDKDEIDKIRAEEKRKVYTFRTKSERLKWGRKRQAIEELIESLKPIQDKLLEIGLEKNKILTKINKLRNDMVEECIHPKDHIIHSEDGEYILCKFCNRRIKINNKNDKET
jgi:hypothetical protein